MGFSNKSRQDYLINYLVFYSVTPNKINKILLLRILSTQNGRLKSSKMPKRDCFSVFLHEKRFMRCSIFAKS